MQIKELTDELKLHALYDALQEQLAQSAYDELPFEKRLQLLLEAEKTGRDNKKIQRLQSLAKLHEKSAAMEEINFTLQKTHQTGHLSRLHPATKNA